MNKVCLVIVTWNRVDVVLKNLECVYAQTILPNHIVLVDNNSNDDTILKVENKYPNVQIIKMNENLGFAAGLATGMKSAIDGDFDFFWLMDDDSFPANDFLELQLSNIPSDCGILGSLGVKHHYFNQTVISQGELTTVDFVLVDCAIVNVNVCKLVGFPDPNMFMMCEDIEFCKRILRTSYKVYCLPNPSINRLHLGSTKNSNSLSWRAYYHSRNHLFILINYFNFKYLTFFISMQTKLLFTSLIQFKFLNFYFRMVGLYHGIISKRGKTLNPQTLKFN